jgi:hypothetical protein
MLEGSWEDYQMNTQMKPVRMFGTIGYDETGRMVAVGSDRSEHRVLTMDRTSLPLQEGTKVKFTPKVLGRISRATSVRIR